MMTGTITDDQARALAAFVAALRPGWDVAGIRAALSKARHRGNAHELAQAAIRATQGDGRTPAVIALDGPHWHPAAASTGDSSFERCPEVGHTSYAAWNCGLCKHDDLDYVPRESVPDPDRDAVYTRGAAAVRAMLAGAAGVER